VLVVMMIFGMMCVPRADGCSNDDSIFICSHGVAHVGRNEQEAANRVRLKVLKVGGLAEADLQYTLYDRNPGVAGMGVKVMESRGNRCGVGEDAKCMEKLLSLWQSTKTRSFVTF